MNFIYKIHVCKCNIFLMGSSSDQYEVTTTILCDKSWFGFYLLDSKRIIPACFHVAFSWNTDFHIFILSPCYSFVLKYVSQRQQKKEFAFKLNVISYLLMGELSPLVFRVIIERYALLLVIFFYFSPVFCLISLSFVIASFISLLQSQFVYFSLQTDIFLLVSSVKLALVATNSFSLLLSLNEFLY